MGGWQVRVYEPAPNPANAQRGMTAQSVGRTTEDAVQEQVARWMAQGKAALTPGHPGVIFLGKDKSEGKGKGRPKAVPKGKGTVDWTGLLHGIPVAFDVKGTSAKTFSATERALPAHEVDFLKKFHRAGGTSFLLVCTEALTAPQWEMWFLAPSSKHPGQWAWKPWPLTALDRLPVWLRQIGRNGELRTDLKEAAM